MPRSSSASQLTNLCRAITTATAKPTSPFSATESGICKEAHSVLPAWRSGKAATLCSRLIDGDGKADLIVWRPSNGIWYVYNLANNQFNAVQFGTTGDKPVIGDYDSDRRADYAVYRPSVGAWYIQRSTLGFTGFLFGAATDTPVPADYDGDGKADIAVFRPSNGVWYLQQSTAGFIGVLFGDGNDKPVPAAFVP